jgi:hypothetical protein
VGASRDRTRRRRWTLRRGYGRVRPIGHGVREFLGAWEELRLEADGFRELDAERVLALDHRSGRSKTSGLELGQMRTKGARLFHIRDGKVTRIVGDRERALADLGLARETD